MNNRIPIFPYLREADNNSKILFSLRGVFDYYPLHSHDFYELELVFKGRGRQWINNVCIPLEPGSLYLLSLNDVHRLEADEPMHILSIHFLPEVAEEIGIPEMHNAYALQLDGSSFETYFALTHSVITEKKLTLPYAYEKMLSITTLLLIHLMREGTQYAPISTARGISKALKYIHTNYSDSSLRLKDVADEYGLSTCYFSTMFHKVIGCSFNEYLTNYRMHFAGTLLLTSDISITEIAYDVGFSSLSQFFRVFKSVYNCTPNEYRRSNTAAGNAFLNTGGWNMNINPAPELE